MIARIAAVLVLITVIVGGIWYFFRDTPAKKVSRWRDLVQNYLEEDRLEDAEFWQDEILKYSGSDQDKMVRAEIGMRKGTRAGIKEAVAMYDIVLASEDPRGQVAASARPLLPGLQLLSLGDGPFSLAGDDVHGRDRERGAESLTGGELLHTSAEVR